MGVYVKGAKMPKACIWCEYAACEKRLLSWHIEKAWDCPMVEVPEHHGRLIDENDVIEAIHERLKELQTHPEFKKKHGDIDLIGVMPYIAKIKTVIEEE